MEDSGPGISDDALPRIFDSLFTPKDLGAKVSVKDLFKIFMIFISFGQHFKIIKSHIPNGTKIRQEKFCS